MAPIRLLAATALIAAALLSVPAAAGAASANSGGGQYLPSVPGGSGPEPAKALGPVAADPEAGSSASAPVEAGLTGTGDIRIGLLFPVLLGLVLAAALGFAFRRVRVRE